MISRAGFLRRALAAVGLGAVAKTVPETLEASTAPLVSPDAIGDFEPDYTFGPRGVKVGRSPRMLICRGDQVETALAILNASSKATLT